MANYLELTDKRPDGTHFGQDSTDKIACHGATPTTQDANVDDVLSTDVSAAAATSTSPFGYASAAQADAITAVIIDLRTTVNSILDVLSNKGLMASS